MRDLVIAVVLASLGCTLVTRAAIGAELSWESPPGCPERDEVAFRVERALGGELAAAAPRHYHVAVRRSPAGSFSASLEAEGKARTLIAPDCGKLADAVAVAIALSLGMSEPAASEVVAPPEPAAPSAPVPDVVAPPAPPAPSESSAARPSVSAWLLADAGTLPELGAGAALGFELGWSRLQLRLLAFLLFEQHVERAGQGLGPDAGADLSLYAGSISACAAALGSFRAGSALFLCAGPELGYLSGSGTGVSEERTGGGLWLAPRLDLGGFWRVPGSSVALALNASAAVPLLRDNFVLEGGVPVHRASSVVGRLALGIELDLD
jgi:hypothetical protein